MRRNIWMYALAMTLAMTLTVACSDDDDNKKVTTDGGNQNPFGACAGLFTGFDACGGDLEGTWEFVSACYPEWVPPYAEECPSATATGSVSNAGTYTFTADTLTVNNLVQRYDIDITMPKSCLEAIGAADCVGLSEALVFEEEEEATCEEVGESCECTYQGEYAAEVDSLTYTVDGGQLTVNDGEEPDVVQFCVQGDMAAIVDSSSSDPFAFIMKKK